MAGVAIKLRSVADIEIGQTHIPATVTRGESPLYEWGRFGSGRGLGLQTHIGDIRSVWTWEYLESITVSVFDSAVQRCGYLIKL
jgi:hypothetical protein